MVGRKKSENSFREDWIDQRERERERLGCSDVLVLRNWFCDSRLGD